MGVSQTAMCLPFIAFISAASAPRPNPLHMTECDVDVALLQLGLQVNSSVNVSLTSLTGGHETQVEGLQKRWLPQAPHLNDKLGFQFSALVAAVLFLLALIEVLGSCCARGRRAAQFVYLASSILNSAGFTILLMVSLPYTESLGRGEVSSGILVSSNAIGGLAAQLLAPRIIPNEADNTVGTIRRASAMTLGGQALAHTAFVFSAYSIRNVDILWWCLIAFRILSGFFGALTNLTASLLALHMSPDSEILNLQTASQACRNLGLCIGGVMSSIALSTFQGMGYEMDTRRLGTVPVMFLVSMVLVVLMANVFFVPDAIDKEVESPHSAPETTVTKEADPQKTQKVFWHAFLYNFERSFSTTAIEVATTMISEQDFGMKPSATGYMFGLITISSFLMNFAVGCTNSDLAARSFVMLVSAIGAIVFVAFLFNVWPWYFIYIGDAFLFTLSNTANGVVDGIATLMAIPGGDYSKKNYMNKKMIAMAVARIGAAPFARGVIFATNRNIYAALQLLLTLLGFRSVYGLYKEFDVPDKEQTVQS